MQADSHLFHTAHSHALSHSHQRMMPPRSLHLYTSNNEENASVKEILSRMWKLAKDSRFRYMIPQFLWTGVSISYYSGILVYMMADTIIGSD